MPVWHRHHPTALHHMGMKHCGADPRQEGMVSATNPCASGMTGKCLAREELMVAAQCSKGTHPDLAKPALRVSVHQSTDLWPRRGSRAVLRPEADTNLQSVKINDFLFYGYLHKVLERVVRQPVHPMMVFGKACANQIIQGLVHHAQELPTKYLGRWSAHWWQLGWNAQVQVHRRAGQSLLISKYNYTSATLLGLQEG